MCHLDVVDVLNKELDHCEFSPGITFTSRLSVMAIPSGKASPTLLASSPNIVPWSFSPDRCEKVNEAQGPKGSYSCYRRRGGG